MSSKVHKTERGWEKCGAEKGRCPYESQSGAHDLVQENETVEQAIERKNKEDYETKPQKKVNYSFIKQFKETQEDFKSDFGDYPKRFFNTNLRNKGKKNLIKDKEYTFNDEKKMIDVDVSLEDRIDAMESIENTKDGNTIRYHDQTIAQRTTERLPYGTINSHLLTAASAPKDNQMSTDDAREKVHELAKEIPDAKVHELDAQTDARLMAGISKNTKRGWIIEYDKPFMRNGVEETRSSYIAVIDDNFANRGQTYSFRGSTGPVKGGRDVVITDLRGLAANERVNRNSHEESNFLADQSKYRNTTKAKLSTLKTLKTMEDSQYDGQNFLAQQKYVKDNTGASVATAFEDKKNVSQTHQELSKNTSLNKKNGGVFSKVEVDNDVDPEEFKSFENDVKEVQDKMPPIPKGQEPVLRIRKLGKHGSATSVVHGLFNPAKNTVAIDVNNSGSYVHEMAHQYDLIVKNNASLNNDFKGIVRDYSQSLASDTEANIPAKRLEYLRTPTEVFARGMESYASERLGINNRLINTDKFNNDDHKPFKNPKLRKRMFDFMDKLYNEDKK